MAKIKGKLIYGVAIDIDVPIAPTKEMMEPFLAKAESMINGKLDAVLKTTLAPLAFMSGLPLLGWLKGAKVTITGSKSQIAIDEVVP